MADAEQEARLLSRIIEVISAGLDLDEIVQSVAALVTDATETDVCFVLILDDSGRRLVLRGATPPFHQMARRIELNLTEGVSGWVATHGEPAVIVDNKLSDPRYKYIAALRGEDFTSMASVPIAVRPGNLVGVLNVHTRRKREFTDSDVELLRSVAGLIENARLHRRLAEREAALERFTERIVLVQEAERRRLAGEIHDGISQRIVSLAFHLSAAADTLSTDAGRAAGQIAKARELAEAALDETRLAIEGLRPPVLDDLGLAASLESLARSFPQLEVRVSAQSRRLPEHVETAVYRVAQEALQNVAKHSGARFATVGLTIRDDQLVLEISDDGRGFDPSAPDRDGRTGHGLRGMRERAELLGGRLELRSHRTRGTTLRLRIPV